MTTSFSWNSFVTSLDHQDSRLAIARLDELFIKFWTLEGALTERGAAITKSQLTNQIVSTKGAAITFKSITEISVSISFASDFFVNNLSRRSSRCPRTISLDDRDYLNLTTTFEHPLVHHVVVDLLKTAAWQAP